MSLVLVVVVFACQQEPLELSKTTLDHVGLKSALEQNTDFQRLPEVYNLAYDVIRQNAAKLTPEQHKQVSAALARSGGDIQHASFDDIAIVKELLLKNINVEFDSLKLKIKNKLSEAYNFNSNDFESIVYEKVYNFENFNAKEAPKEDCEKVRAYVGGVTIARCLADLLPGATNVIEEINVAASCLEMGTAAGDNAFAGCVYGQVGIPKD